MTSVMDDLDLDLDLQKLEDLANERECSWLSCSTKADVELVHRCCGYRQPYCRKHYKDVRDYFNQKRKLSHSFKWQCLRCRARGEIRYRRNVFDKIYAVEEI